MDGAWRLFYRRDIYDHAGTDVGFASAVRANVAHHLARCPDYAALLASRGFSAADADAIRTAADVWRIPPLPTSLLKRHALRSGRTWLLRSTTSGTSGAAGEMGLDMPSAARGLGMVLGVMRAHRLLSPRPCNYVVLGYEPARRNRVGAVKTAYAMTYTAPALRRVYALRDTGDAYALNLDGVLDALAKYARAGHPVRFMGFPAYFFFLLQEMERTGLRVQLHPRSWIFLSGGWKQFWTQRVEKEALYALAEERLGLPESRVREFFGAVEHPIAYADCGRHHFHVPVYSRVLVRDPWTLEPVPDGVPGLLNLVTPMLKSMPYTSVLTDDLAVRHPGETCGCGCGAPWFELLGRVGDVRTCAAGAAELLDVLKGGGAG